MAFTVFCPRVLHPEGERIMAESGLRIIRGSGPEKEAVLREVAEADALVACMPYQYDREILDAAQNCKLIVRFGVGLEIIDVAYAQSKGILVCNTPGANTNAVAQHAMFLILACAQNARFVDSRMREGEFMEVRRRLSTELEGKVLGIVGPGNIARLVAQKAKYGFGMRPVTYLHRPGAQVPEDTELVSGLEELLARADFLLLSAPETPQTVGMIGMEQLRRMKPGAFLINIARGRLVKEDELIDALQQGVIRGAGLDVFQEEPLDLNSPLFRLDNTYITPHYAAFSQEATRNTSVDVAEALVAVSRGERPRYLVPAE